MTRMSRAVALGALFATLAAAVLVAVWFLTFDEGGIRRGDLAYYVFIPADVRALPAHAACDEPVFAKTTNDSLEAETIKMEFRSRAEVEAFVAAYETEFARWACSGAPPSASDPAVTLRCANPDAEIKLRTGLISNGTGCRPVALEFRF